MRKIITIMECVSKRETLWGHHVGRQRGEVECTGE
jgi:hypothetical protein